MAEQGKKGQITIVAKKIKGKAEGKVLEESRQTKNVVGGSFYQNGNKGGVSNNKKQDRKPPLELRVLKVEGPFDEKNKKVETLKKISGIPIKLHSSIENQRKVNYKTYVGVQNMKMAP